VNLFFYKMMALISRIVGLWFAEAMSWIIATGFFFLFAKRRAVCVEFYRVLYPEKGLFYAWRLALDQYHHSATLFVDRLRLGQDNISWTVEGGEILHEAERKGTGGVLLMSHFGNWEVAARSLAQEGIRLMLFMGAREQEQIEGLQKMDIVTSGIRIAYASEKEASPLELLEGVRFLEEGGFVSLPGDKVWTDRQRILKVEFRGREVSLPAAPFVLAMTSGAPLFAFFVTRLGRGNFRVKVHAPIEIKKHDRAEREAVLLEAARKYLSLLEGNLLAHPEHWHHFDPWLGPEIHG